MPPTRILVTGCSSGLGRAIAIEAARREFEVIATVRDRDGLSGLLRHDRVLAERIQVELLDVRLPTRTRELVDAIGPVDVLVNNAGFCHAEAFYDVSLDVVRETLETNFLGAVHLIKAVLPTMIERRGGTIVNISSIAGSVALPGLAAYGASKHALAALSDSLRHELCGSHVNVVVIEPGLLATRMLDANRSNGWSPDAPSPLARRFRTQRSAALAILGPRIGDPHDVARRVLDIAALEKPRPRYRIGMDARALALLSRTKTLPLALNLAARTQRPGRAGA